MLPAHLELFCKLFCDLICNSFQVFCLKLGIHYPEPTGFSWTTSLAFTTRRSKCKQEQRVLMRIEFILQQNRCSITIQIRTLTLTLTSKSPPSVNVSISTPSPLQPLCSTRRGPLPCSFPAAPAWPLQPTATLYPAASLLLQHKLHRSTSSSGTKSNIASPLSLIA